eukprot:m.86313 g.86313  ORF g.86313 m.86313 type:complete len:353 (-) comp15082_c0_seq1:396-1454(-)
MASSPVRIAVIGGSGLYKLAEGRVLRELDVTTPFGRPSAKLLVVDIEGIEVVFLPRHGAGHVFNPSEVNYRANIFALKSVGVEWLISVSAVGSLREDIQPGEIVTVNQFIDRTVGRKATFFEKGIVAHVPFAVPVCETLRAILTKTCTEVGAKVHDGGVYVNMEGPAFSTVAESNLHRSWGASVIGMTVLTEAKLAREAEISYAVLAMATDFDCWKEDHASVTVDQVVAVLHQNAGRAQAVVLKAIPKIAAIFQEPPPPARHALRDAIMTADAYLPAERLRALAPLVSKYKKIPGQCPLSRLCPVAACRGSCCSTERQCPISACTRSWLFHAGLAAVVAAGVVQTLRRHDIL